MCWLIGAISCVRHKCCATTRVNAMLARAFRLEDEIVVGDLVWRYNAPATHTAAIGMAPLALARATLSRRFLDQWQGPFPVLDHY